MINLKDKIGGFAILCDENGLITTILRDDLGLTKKETKGKLFSNFIEKDNRRKAMNFILDVKANDAAFNYQMNVWLKNDISTLSFIGIKLSYELLIIGAKNQEDAIEFTNHLQQINNEQANLIRKLMKEKIQAQNQVESNREKSLEDLSRLNNELINLQRELAKKNAELERLNEIKNNFLGMAAHDLRNPLAVIQSYSQYLIEKSAGYLPPKQLKFVNTIYSTTQFMLNLIEDLLDVSKIESGKLELNKEIFNIVEFAKNNIELNKPLANKKGIDINLDYEQPEMFVEADHQKIEQVFNNLVSNAIKFSYPDTTIHVNISTEKTKVNISVQDKGTGISPQKLETLFQPFQKGQSTGTEGEKGTGLGLVIVKRIIEGHGGSISIDSEEKKGTHVKFNIPLSQTEKKEKKGKEKQKTEEEQPKNQIEGKTVLVIEDERISRRFIEEILNPHGAKVVSCANGEEALQAYKEHPAIDLAVVDLNLPDMDGYDLIQKLHEQNKELPIIVETAHVLGGEKEKALFAGASDYLTKPLDPQKFIQLLNNYLSEKK